VLEIKVVRQIAEGPDSRNTRLVVVVDFDSTIVVKVDPGCMEPESIAIWLTTDRDQEHLSFNRLGSARRCERNSA
jgi:hypothetical protein